MGSLRTLFGILVLSAIGYGVYVSMTRNPKPASRLEQAPRWAGPTASTAPVGTAPAAKPAMDTTPLVPPTVTLGTPIPTTAPGVASMPVVSVPAPGTETPGAPPLVPAPTAPLATSPAATNDRVVPASALESVPQEVQQAASPVVRSEFAAFMQAIYINLEAGRIEDGHRAMSSLYGNPRLTPEETRQLNDLLDQTAGTLIYSRQHLLEPAYRVQQGDTIEKIGDRYGVPGELLAKINGISMAEPLVPNTDLKVIRGPFDARIDLTHAEMSLFLQGRYAGRFKIAIGRDQAPVEGTFNVRAKPVATMTSTVATPADLPAKRYLELDHHMTIHSIDHPEQLGRADSRGCIGLSDRDLNDVYDILSVGSLVTIRR